MYIRTRVSRATHHENESASQILAVDDLTRGPRRRGVDERKGREKAKSCVHITGSSTFQSAAFALAGPPFDRSSEKPQTHSGRQVRILWETARRASEKL